ncbi:MAG TPA: hypothetical protein PKM65_05660 [Spirochaetota bacterium]|nr:hypothetical protein [Spirochaetota bacterium]HNT10159.1 hypothetical protein [Spirochaetota bacterium]
MKKVRAIRFPFIVAGLALIFSLGSCAGLMLTPEEKQNREKQANCFVENYNTLFNSNRNYNTAKEKTDRVTLTIEIKNFKRKYANLMYCNFDPAGMKIQLPEKFDMEGYGGKGTLASMKKEVDAWHDAIKQEKFQLCTKQQFIVRSIKAPGASWTTPDVISDVLRDYNCSAMPKTFPPVIKEAKRYVDIALKDFANDKDKTVMGVMVDNPQKPYRTYVQGLRTIKDMSIWVYLKEGK